MLCFVMYSVRYKHWWWNMWNGWAPLLRWRTQDSIACQRTLRGLLRTQFSSSRCLLLSDFSDRFHRETDIILHDMHLLCLRCKLLIKGIQPAKEIIELTQLVAHVL